MRLNNTASKASVEPSGFVDGSNLSSGGSLWHRWDPHIHTPETILNDDFASDSPWDDYFRKINDARPIVRALGITDYLSIDRYLQVRSAHSSGLLPNVSFVFPNVEMRLDIPTDRGSGVNIHLLFSPDDPDHVEQIRSLLSTLRFDFEGNNYACQSDDLARLGKTYARRDLPFKQALQEGINQFKVNFTALKNLWKQSGWMRENCLIAVAGNRKDGSSGVRDADGSFTALRKDLEAFAHIMFTATPQQISYWLGQTRSVQEIERDYGGLKPCLHGSDAHDFERVCAPDANRFCWIKGDLCFDSLRQLCIEPEQRVSIGSAPPSVRIAGQAISSISVANASWLHPSELALNSGLVAIIGARGSGKTALADLIATGAGCVEPIDNERSFISRASEHLSGAITKLEWGDGHCTRVEVGTNDDSMTLPDVQYLSQQFVDQLCASDGLADSLVREIERVIFDSVPINERECADNFAELRTYRTGVATAKRQRSEEEFRLASTRIDELRAFKKRIPEIEKEVKTLESLNEREKREKGKLFDKKSADRVKRLETLIAARDRSVVSVNNIDSELRVLKELKDHSIDFKERQSKNALLDLRRDYPSKILTDEDWSRFLLKFSGDVHEVIDRRAKELKERRVAAAGSDSPPTSPVGDKDSTPLVPENADLASTPLSLLNAEIQRLEHLVGVDGQNAKRIATFSARISERERKLISLKQEIEKGSQIDSEIQKNIAKRRDAYKGVFQALAEEEAALRELYAPLSQRVASDTGTLGKLSFSIKRSIDIEVWAEQGEQLLDLRKNGSFRGRGALLACAQEALLSEWRNGTPEEISEAMQRFIATHLDSIKAHMPDNVDQRNWFASISQWLLSTNHVSVSYSLEYNGIDIVQLSPGTRGIVLLLLYLGIDQQDARPLVIDQPEENLDPQSVYEELVGLCREAKKRRQIIIVTHNANLVVNTDADQVIVSSASNHAPGRLPDISYISGGLENAAIRKKVCDILEGGERAFRERAKRLRVGGYIS